MSFNWKKQAILNFLVVNRKFSDIGNNPARNFEKSMSFVQKRTTKSPKF